MNGITTQIFFSEINKKDLAIIERLFKGCEFEYTSGEEDENYSFGVYPKMNDYDELDEDILGSIQSKTQVFLYTDTMLDNKKFRDHILKDITTHYKDELIEYLLQKKSI